MKKIIFAALVSLALVACEKENNTPQSVFTPAPCYEDDGKPRKVLLPRKTYNLPLDVMPNGMVLARDYDTIRIYDKNLKEVNKIYNPEGLAPKCLSDNTFITVKTEKSFTNIVQRWKLVGWLETGRDENCEKVFTLSECQTGKSEPHLTTSIIRYSTEGKKLSEVTLDGYGGSLIQHGGYLYCALFDADSISANVTYGSSGVFNDTILCNSDGGIARLYKLDLNGNVIWKKSTTDLIMYSPEPPYLTRSGDFLWINTNYEILQYDLNGNLLQSRHYPKSACKERLRAMVGIKDGLVISSTDPYGAKFTYQVNLDFTINDFSIPLPAGYVGSYINGGENTFVYYNELGIYKYNNGSELIWENDVQYLKLENGVKMDCHGNFYAFVNVPRESYIVKITSDGRDPF